MIGLVLNLLRGPISILASIGTFIAIFGCVRCCCRRPWCACRLRDCACAKRLLRFLGIDKFDDFELLLLVHEVAFERREGKMQTVVRVTAGAHSVQTDSNSNGIFQQPLHINVEQGTRKIRLDLLDHGSRVLATLGLDIVQDILSSEHPQHELTFPMKQKSKGIRNPKVKITIVPNTGEDDAEAAEQGLLQDMSSDVNFLVASQLRKAKAEGRDPHGGGPVSSELEVLKQACSGPLEIFEGLGKTSTVYVAVLGPPISRRWVLGVWADKNDYQARRHAMEEVDLLKIQSVQADPTRHHVFIINYYDESRVRQVFTFRRVDRARDVWVEILHLVVGKARENRKAVKSRRELELTHRDTTAVGKASAASPSPQSLRSHTSAAQSLQSARSPTHKLPFTFRKAR